MSQSPSPRDESHDSLTVIQITEPGLVTYTLETAADLSGVHPEMLRYYCRIGLLGPEFQRTAETELRFDDNALYELGWIEFYRNHHGVNRQALAVIFELRHDLQRLQNEVRFLRGL